MRNEIITQRQQISDYRTENKELIDQVKTNQRVVEQVGEFFNQINQFKNHISDESIKAKEMVEKSANE